MAETVVHEVHCQAPNSKLRRVLQRSGFALRDIPGACDVYYSLATLDAESSPTTTS